MIRIEKSKNKQYYVVLVGDNGEVLSTSETLKTKQSAWVNIAAQAKCFGSLIVADGDKVYRFENSKKIKMII